MCAANVSHPGGGTRLCSRVGFPLMNLDLGMDPQVGAAHHVDVIQEGKQRFMRTQSKLQSDERVVLSEGEQCWHQRVALFPAFALLHVMHCTFIILPQIRGWGPAKMPDERQHGHHLPPTRGLGAWLLGTPSRMPPIPSMDSTMALGSVSVRV